tara:strand:+ start:221 stop:400 length:180 start_codon:yes stop_codon:yes gene_type:complete
MTMQHEEGISGTMLHVYNYKNMEVIINDQYESNDETVSVTNIDNDGTYHNVEMSELEMI